MRSRAVRSASSAGWLLASTREQANAELRVFGERTAAALPATHEHLRPRVMRLGEASMISDIAQFALRNLPVLLVLIIACMSVGTLVYARTATREGEIAVRSALGASRARIIGQLFVEALVLASVAAAVGLIAADRALRWGIENVNRATGGAPFWMTPGLKLSTILYAGGLAVVSAAMLSLLPALKVTRARLQPHLANLGSGGATLRFGRVWTGAMIVQVALTAIGIPVAMETASQAMRKLNIRAAFPSREYLAARIDVDRPFEEETTPAFEERRAQTFAELERRVAQEPGVVAVTFADRAPGSGATSTIRRGRVLAWRRAGVRRWVPDVGGGPGILRGIRSPDCRRPCVPRGRLESRRTNGHRQRGVRARVFARRGQRLADRRSPAVSRADPRGPTRPPRRTEPWFEIVGVVRDIGLDPDDEGDELPYVFHPASAETVSPLVMSVRMRGNPATLAARLPVIAADVDARLLVQDAQPLDEWVRQRDDGLTMTAGALAAVTALVLFLSALGIFSLVSVSVSRRTREIGLRAALGANPRHVLAGILSRAMVLMGSGITAGGALLLLSVALGQGPSGRPAEDVALFAGYLGVTSAVMLAACLLACIGPARRALRINPTDALREA